jgi:spore coat protein H
MNSNFVLNSVKVGLSLLLFGSTLTKSHAQGIVTINPKFFHADSARKLVVINAPLQQLNTARQDGDSIRALVANGQSYVLARAVSKLSTAATYQAKHQAKTYTVYFTRVPVLHFQTRHQIADAPSVYARLVLTDTTGVVAQSATGIEFRGASSQGYPKKSYELSLWADSLGNTNQDLALLGMRTSNKWNLQAMYNDQLRMRLKVANELWQDMNQVYYKAQEPAAKSGIGVAYTEVFINDRYQGVYALTERVDRKQLKLKKYANSTIMGELYKGVTGLEAAIFSSVPAFDNTSETWGGFEYKEPSEQIDWANLHSFANLVVNGSDTDFYNQYKSKFNLANAVDYFLFLNLMRATDNTGKNTYIAKYKPNEPYFYVPWDLDGVLGNDWTGANVNVTSDILSNGFYDRLRRDHSAGGFQAAVASRWSSLRTSVITSTYITAKIKKNSDYLLTNKVYEREQRAWPSYQYDAAQLAYPTTWLTDRLTYLDAIFRPATALSAAGAAEAAELQLSPNPASDYLYATIGASPCQLTIRNVQGKIVLQTTLTSSRRVALNGLPQGLYLASMKSATVSVVRKIVVQ